MRSLHCLSFYFACASLVAAQYTVYQPKEQVIFGGTNLHLTATSTAAAANFTSSGEANDSTVLTPPAIPQPPIPTVVPIELPSSGGFQNMSPPANGGFMGFSIEMSVSNQVCPSSYSSSALSTLTNAHLSGQEQVRDSSSCTTPAIPISTFDSSLLQVPFLNLLANIVERVGWVQVRVGGNSQESAELVGSLPNGTLLAKDYNKTTGPTGTPPLEYTLDLLQMMENISKLVNVHWYLGRSLCATTSLLKLIQSKASPFPTIPISR
jgi:hypothetical protein